MFSTIFIFLNDVFALFLEGRDGMLACFRRDMQVYRSRGFEGLGKGLRCEMDKEGVLGGRYAMYTIYMTCYWLGQKG